MPVRRPRPHVVLLVGAAACWGVGTVLSKQALADVPPLTLLPLQLAASCAFLGVVCLLTGVRPARSPGLGRLAVLGVLNPGIAYALGLLGLASITASMSVLLWATEPVLIVLLAVAVLHERPQRLVVLLLVTAVGGVLLVVHEPGSAGDPLGIVLTLAAVAACAVYTVLARRLLLDDASVTVALAQQGAALAFAVSLAVAVHVRAGDVLDLGSMSGPAWASAVVSGVLYYGAAFWLYLAGLRLVPASVAASSITLVPVFGVAVGLVVGERLEPRQWLGALVVVAAVAAIAAHDARSAGQRVTANSPLAASE